MPAESILPKLRGPFNFLTAGQEEVRFHFPELERSLPSPVPIFLGDGSSSPVYGYPVVVTDELRELEAALRAYLIAEERSQVARLNSGSLPGFSLKEQQDSWQAYCDLLLRVSENVMTSNFGRRFPELFWLHQSLAAAKVLQGTPNRVRKLDLEIGRQRGDALRYVVLFQFLERVFAVLFDLAAKLAAQTNQLEDELFPGLLTRMRDNVLVFTEDHIGRDLQELISYFRGYLKIDGRDLLYRYAQLRSWHRGEFASDARLRSAARGWVLPKGAELEADAFLLQPRYIEHLMSLPDYRPEEFFSRDEARLWSALVLRLKEFEFFQSARRLITPLERKDGGFVCDARAASRLGAGAVAKTIDPQTRPYDFTARWIVDPEVARSGLIYDIRDFSSSISVLRLSERRKQNEAFQQFLFFQHRVETIVHSLTLHSEKYLGDGAFFSGRDAIRILSASILIQRAYRDALAGGLPFDRGMRLALNHSRYHLLPLGSEKDGNFGRYEVYGHGLVELTRLVSGKRQFDLDELKTNLLTRGYDDEQVTKFFRPLSEQTGARSDLGETPFRAHLGSDGTLVNEGIVATHAFLQRLERQYKGTLGLVERHSQQFITLRYRLEKAAERGEFQVAFRRLGLANLKGLDEIGVYEIVDAGGWDVSKAKVPMAQPLIAAVDALFTSTLAKPKQTR